MIKSLIWSFMEQGGSKLASLIVQVVLARLLAPDVFGVLAILLVFTNVADILAQSGLGSALIQRCGSDDDYSTAFWMSLGLSILLYVVLFAIAPLVAWFYEQDELTLLLRVLSIIVLFNSLNSIQRSYLQRSMDFEGLFKANVLAIVLSGVVGVTAALLGCGIWALVVQKIALSVIAFLSLLVFVPWKPSLHFELEVAKEMFAYGWKVCATGILNTVYSGVSDLIIGKACSAGELGYYSQGRKWPLTIINMITGALQNVFFPAFSELKEQRDKLVASIKRFLVSGSFVFVPVALFCAAASEPLVAIILSDTWLPSVPVFQLTCISYSLLLLEIVNLRAYMALGESGLYLRLQIVKSGFGSVVICAVALLTRNIYAIAVGTAVVTALSILVVDLRPAKRILGYSRLEQVRDILPTYALATMAALVAWALTFLNVVYPLMLLAQALAYLAIYLGGAAIFRLQGLKDCLVILSRIKSSLAGAK